VGAAGLIGTILVGAGAIAFLMFLAWTMLKRLVG
jgi:hypothetical protein